MSTYNVSMVIKMKNEQLVVENMRLAYSRAYLFDKGVIDVDELKSIALFGLVKAAKTFNYDKNVKFVTYATTVIDNEIKCYLRINKKTLSNVSLDYEYDNGLTLKDKLIDEEKNFEINLEEKDLCRNAFEKIKEYSLKEQKMFYLYICDGYTTSLIANIIGVSQSYVSRILRRIFDDMREEFKINCNQKRLTKNKINSII